MPASGQWQYRSLNPEPLGQPRGPGSEGSSPKSGSTTCIWSARPAQVAQVLVLKCIHYFTLFFKTSVGVP